jgi:fructose-specific phosphotransferase system component IIB
VSKPFSLIVTDTSPLFTLVLAESLDLLLRPGLPVRIPDAVYIEATRVHGAPGAEQIVEWINCHLGAVQIVPTDIGIDQQRRLEEGRAIRGLGEQAAIETLERFLRSDPAAEALLLFEDTDIEKRRAVVDQRVSLISTGDFLRELETAGLIQSTDYILDRAAAQGRNVQRQRQAGEDAATRERLREQLTRRGDQSEPR